MKPEVVSSKTIYEGNIFDVFLAKIRQSQVEYEREIVFHNGSAVIVPVFADKTVALVKQYRHPAQKYLYEIPAGSLEKGESPEEGARRELEEEIGVRAGNLEKLIEFFVSPGFLTEKMFVYLATDLAETEQKLEEDELIEIKKVTFSQAFEMIRKNEIEDAKTIVGLILAGVKLGFNFG
ncbi:MAG: NUDIX hydrolase [Acidobacteria bacterium]|nr:NUDIX hydrolase [Acidobacteriota bacterium]MCA1637891.1 NUDIX hydrolase [Acidobacteriota bacterium]